MVSGSMGQPHENSGEALSGDAAEMIPAVYDELKKLANARMSHENPQTIGATALVHEAYLRLLKPEDKTQILWTNHRHFFAAAAESMRRIMIERARARNAAKRGGGKEHQVDGLDQIEAPVPDDEIIQIGEALEQFSDLEPDIANIVKMKYFVGLKWDEISQVTGIPTRTLRRQWAFARSWLFKEIKKKNS